MNQNMFFTVETDGSSETTLRVIPTNYLEELHPQKAISEMQEYIDTLENALEHHGSQSNFDPLKFHGLGSLAFELELVRTFLASFKQVYGTMH